MHSKVAARYLIVNVALLATLFLAACCTSSATEDRNYVDEARQARQSAQMGKAELLAELAIEEDRRADEARQLRAEIARQKAQAHGEAGENHQAYTAYIEAAEFEPSRVQRAHDIVDAVHAGDGADIDGDALLEHLLEALDGLPRDADLRRDIARRAEDLRRDDLAISHYLWLFSADPEDVRAGLRLGLLYRANDSLVDAAAVLRRVYRAQPENTQAALNLANIYVELRRYADAEEIFESLHERFPDHPAILRDYANFEDRRGNHDRAEQLRDESGANSPTIEEREMRPLR